MDKQVWQELKVSLDEGNEFNDNSLVNITLDANHIMLLENKTHL